MAEQTPQEAKAANLKLEIVEKMSGLVTAGLGLVAGLAWNDAIQSAFAVLFPAQGSLIAKFLYAALITIIIVVLTLQLGRMSNLLKQQLDKKKL